MSIFQIEYICSNLNEYEIDIDPTMIIKSEKIKINFFLKFDNLF